METTWVRRAALPLAVSAVLVALGLAVRLTAPGALEPGERPSPALRLLDVNRERNLPTAWSVGLLLTCSWAALHLTALERGGRTLLAAVPAVMAVDEALQVHERADALGRLVAGDALHFAWVVPGALVAALVAAAALRTLRRAPALLRRRLAVAAGLYLTGALLLEAVSGRVLETVGRGSAYAVLNAAEEGLEMTGACLALAALLLAAEATRREPALAAAAGSSPRR